MKRERRKVTDPDILGVGPALRRAARRARELAARTNTPLVIWRDGKVVKLYPGRRSRGQAGAEGIESIE